MQERLRGLSQSAALRIAYPHHLDVKPVQTWRRATELASIPVVQARLAYLLDQAAGRAVADRAEILRRHTAAARARFAPLAHFLSVGPDGEPRIDLNPENLRLPAVKRVKVKLNTSGEGDGKGDSQIVDLEFHDYLDADRETAKILGLYAADRLEVGGPGGGPVQVAWTVAIAERPRSQQAQVIDAPKAIPASTSDEREA